MSRVKLLSLLAAGLFVINAVLVLFILFRAPGPPPHKMPREIIIERLHFTEAQVSDYDKQIAWHRSEIRKADAQMIALKSRLYSSISGKKNSVPNDTLLASIARLQMKVEIIHYRHFEEIRQLCTPQQLPYFNALLKSSALK